MSVVPSIVGRKGPAVVLLTVMLLVVAAVIAARWGMANAIAADALAAKVEWQDSFLQSGVLPTVNERNAVYAELSAARGMDPRNPELMEQSGALLLTPVAAVEAELSAGSSAAQSVQQQAIDAFSAAVVARPVSAYAWVNLALSKYQAGQVDKVLYQSLENAARLGPWEPEVQLAVTDLGFALWDEMPPTLQPTVIQMATNAQQRYADKVFGIAERRGRMAVVCSLSAGAQKGVENKLENTAGQLAKSRCQRSLAS